MLAKADLRHLSRERLSLLSKEKKRLYSDSICSQLINYIDSNKVQNIATFMPISSEPNIVPFMDLCIARSLSIYLPKCLGDSYAFVRFQSYDDLCLGPYSIQEPSSHNDILESSEIHTLYLVPGLVFSQSGKRIGHGKGIYDRLLKDVESTKIGICFPEQLFDEWDSATHDISVDTIMM